MENYTSNDRPLVNSPDRERKPENSTQTERKPDLPLRLLSRLLRIIFASPLGAGALRIFRKIFPADEKDWVEITHHCISLAGLHPAFHGYRLVQISDFHLDTWLTARHLREAVALVNSQMPDMVVITGDFVTYNPVQYAADLIDTLKNLSPRDGVMAILGNHDHWTDPDLIRSVIKAIGAIDLSNQIYTVERLDGKLHFAGVDDYMVECDRLDLVLEQLPGDGAAAILLAHEPDFADIAAASGRFGLQLSGHSHGGQIRLPFLGAPILPRHARKYPSGFYQVRSMTLYTNRGLGTAEFNIRWNCRPEISVFTLMAKT